MVAGYHSNDFAQLSNRAVCTQTAKVYSIFGGYQVFLPLILAIIKTNTAQKMKFSINDFFSKCGHIHRKLRIWSNLLQKSLMENSIFCTV